MLFGDWSFAAAADAAKAAVRDPGNFNWSFLIYDREPRVQVRWIGGLAALNIILLCVLVPLGII